MEKKQYGKITVQSSLSNTNEEKLIEIAPFETEPAKVGMQVGFTLPLGNDNFSFIKMAVSIERPCYKE
ncbi:MAG: hypothetical protein WC783_00755 [Candidatus Paceibacterota bacterium]|jgi:hypothetical protein